MALNNLYTINGGTPKPVISSVAKLNVPTTNNTSSSSSGTSSSNVSNSNSGNVDYYSQLMAAIEAQAAAQRQAKIAALENQLNTQLSAYDQQASQLEPQYQTYRNQSEVERYKAQKALRESLANRGALDSGAGRQETLDLQNNYGNNLNAINLQQQAELDAINRAKQQLISETEFQKQQAAADVDNVGLSAKIQALQDQIANQQTQSRAAASSYSGAQTQSQIGSNAISDTAVSSPTDTSATYNKYAAMLSQNSTAGASTAVLALLKNEYEKGNLTESDLAKLSAQFNLKSSL